MNKKTGVTSIRLTDTERQNVDELKALLPGEVTIKDMFMQSVYDKLYELKNMDTNEYELTKVINKLIEIKNNL